MKNATYDVKSFLSHRKKKKSFISITVRSSVIRIILFAIGLLSVLIGCIKLRPIAVTLEYVNKWGVYNALPFLLPEEMVSGKKIFSAVNRQYPLFVIPLATYAESETQNKTPQKNKEEKPLVIEEQIVSGGLEIKNDTSYPIDVNSILAEEIPKSNRGHRVLIVHTHASESYTPTKENTYTHTGNYRTQNTKYNMIRIGAELAEVLEQKGIEVIHDKTINDYPSYNDSYNKTSRVIKKYLDMYPDIGYVFDIHRDAVGSSDSPVKFAMEIHGKKVSQIMIVCGTDTNLYNPHWRQNLALALHIQNYFDVNYTGLLRPLNLRKERFNMHLTTGSLLFEIGTNGNTLEESLHGVRLFGEGLGEIILNLENKG